MTRQVRRTITVNGENSDPIGDPPELPPTDDPVVTESPLYQTILKAWPLIRTDAAKAMSGRVAENIEAMGRKCESGLVRENANIWRELSKRNRETLGLETSAWNPVANVLQQQFQSLALPHPAAHAVHLKATAAAIRAASKQNLNSNNRNLR